MKKSITKTISLMLAVLMLALPLTACGGSENSASGKEQINLTFYIGEFGDEWVNNLAAQWNATNDKYEVKVHSHMMLCDPIIADVKSGTKYDIILAEDANYNKLFSSEYLVDLTDVLETVAPGDSVTIGDKLQDRDAWIAMTSKDGATYAVPYNISPTGLIFDYDRFRENGWLFDKDGKLGGSNGVHPGRDGIEGTYDDGQPQNMSQFKAMCEKIRNSGTEVFLFMGGRKVEYINNVAYAYLGQYLGEEGFKAFYTHESNGVEYEMADGTKTAFTIEDGYKSFQLKGIQEMAKFVGEYIVNRNYVSDATLNDVALTVDASHTQFLMEEAAIIIEGNWFENGSRQLIDSLGKYDPDAKAYGETDYRYMLVPASEEGKSFIGSQTGGCIIVPQHNDEEKLAAVKDFLVFMLSDKSMSQVTRDTGLIWNYHYNISDEDMAATTQFTKNTYALVQDTENIHIHSMFLNTASTPIHAYSALGCGGYMYLSMSTQMEIIQGLTNDAGGDINKLMSNIAEYNTPERWAGWLEQARSYGYYN